MPNYDYKCPKCSCVKEIFHRINDIPNIVCACGDKMYKAISNSPVHFKGSGFYETDYKGKS
jgi:putative FmdB family regulatory protein